MKIIEEALNGLLLIEPRVFRDNRGYFFESFKAEKYSESGINFNFVQDNLSKSSRNTIRGLHYQIEPMAQGKLCQVVYGRVRDVAVDIRHGSSTYGQAYITELSDENFRQLWIPPGFAHGFLVLSETAVFNYKCTKYYSQPHERSILFNDPELNIQWGCDHPIVSEKDLGAKPFSTIEKDFTF